MLKIICCTWHKWLATADCRGCKRNLVYRRNHSIFVEAVLRDSPVQITQRGAFTQALTVPLTARIQATLDIIKVLILQSLNQLQQVHQQILHAKKKNRY